MSGNQLHPIPCTVHFSHISNPKDRRMRLSQRNRLALPSLFFLKSTWIQQRPEHAEYVCMYTFSAPRANDGELHPVGGCRQAAELRGDGLPDLWIWLARHWAGVPGKHVTCCESYCTCSTDVTAGRGRPWKFSSDRILPD
jgi:hypothetical protein